MLIGISSLISFVKGVANRVKAPLHTIRIRGTGLVVNFIEIMNTNRNHDHTISITSTDLTVNLIHTDDL